MPANPSSALVVLKNALAGSHGDIYQQRISSPTVKVEFFGDPDFEVVPAWLARTVGGDEVFWIPGPHDEWAESAPSGHLRFVNTQNDRLGKRVKPMVRLLKQWKAYVKAPVSSFYLEMRVAEFAKAEANMLIHSYDLPALMGKLINNGLCDMNDPTHLVSRISAVSSENNRSITVRMLKDAKERLDEARMLDEKPDQRWAYYNLMASVFGSTFPYPTW